MGLYANLPALVPAVIALIVLSIGAALVLVFNEQPEVRRIVRTTWAVGVALIVSGAAIFWLATAMVQGPKRAVVDRNLQKAQQDELHQRLSHGGH